jgi:hypothetical protein
MRIKNGLVIGVILLFIGVTIQPSVITVQLDTIDVEYYDVTTEFIGLDKEYTTQLTKEEIQKLDALFNSINECLNKSKSMKESVERLKEAIIELDSLALLGDIGIQQTEKLVTSYYQNPKLMNALERIYNREKGALDDKNIFCLIVGKTAGFVFLSPMVLLSTILLMLYFAVHGDFYYPEDEALFIVLVLMVLTIPSVFIPFCLGRMVGFEDWSSGKILSFGLYGPKYWNGNLKGNLVSPLLGIENIGMLGFTGLKIEVITKPYQYFLGFAIQVHIEDS